MKKLILFAAILFAGVSVANAEGKTSSSGLAKLNVELHPVQSIVVHGDVTIKYASSDNYQDGVTSSEHTTLKVVSAGKYAISVNASAFTGGPSPIKTSSIIAKASIVNSTNAKLAANGVALGNEGETDSREPLITATKGGSEEEFHVTYTGAKSNSYIANFNAGDGTVQKYETTVTYTIAAQ